MRCIAFCLLSCIIGLWLTPPALAAKPISDADRKFFENKIRPVLVKHCYECHAADSKEIGGSLILDQPAAMIQGGESGAAIVAGQPDKSLLIQALQYKDIEMPPEGPLPEPVVNDFVRWIQRGAADPRETEPSKVKAIGEWKDLDQEALWSFQPRSRSGVPQVTDDSWPRDPLDYYILSKINASGLEPTADADPRTWIRRVYFDLIGLPPTADEIRSFVTRYKEDPIRSRKSLVDVLLNDPAFGERWGRHWLDVARYGESNGDDGLGRNATFPHAWRYRDYVIDAFNRDLPYDDFLREQIAGDLLDSSDADERNRRLTATGFLAIGSKPAAAMNKDFPMDIVDDQINVVSTTVMGLSVSCARCHDHKHDPISTRDYYAMAGIFTSTETLYGLAGNEKLTAPPTPLHELRGDWKKDDPNQHRVLKGNAPKLPDAFGLNIESLNPVLYARLDAKTKGLELDEKFKCDDKNYAHVNDTKIHGKLPDSSSDYSVTFWFKNETKNNARPITAYLFSRAKMGDKALPGDHLGIGGTHDKSRTGKLFIFNGNKLKTSLAGGTVIPANTWNHVSLIRLGDQVQVYLNGRKEIDGELKASFGESTDYCLARRSDRFAPLKGFVGQFTVFDRALSPDETLALYDATGIPRAKDPIVYPLAMGVREKAKSANCKIHINGSGTKLGPEVPRGFLSVFQMTGYANGQSKHTRIDPKRSGRLELVNWLAHPDHPQTARVMVNRIWMHLFGQPIVATPDDFGVYGARPTHPELLDHLAQRFVDQNWSIKRLIRQIVLSKTYGLSSRASQEILVADPDNRLQTRHSIRRMDAESLRDSMLLVSGSLDKRPGNGSAISEINQLINWPPGEATNLHKETNHRSIYLCMLRHDPPEDLAAFDLPDGVAIVGRRNETTLPTQSLFVMNSQFVVRQAEHIATTLLATSLDDTARVQAAFQTILQRGASDSEVERALDHVQTVTRSISGLSNASQHRKLKSWASLCQGLLSTNEFRYID